MKTKNLKARAFLALPLMAIIGGFFIHNLYIAIPLWVIALVFLACRLYTEVEYFCEGNTWLDIILVFTSMYILGLAILPFALAYLIIYEIFKIVVMILMGLMSLTYRYKEGLKCFFIPLFLYISIWSLLLSFALIKDFLPFMAGVWTSLLVLGFSTFYGIKLVKKYQNRHKYLTFNGVILLFSICAAIVGFCNLDWITLDWCGIFLVFWLIKTIIILFIFSLVTLIVLTIILKVKKKKA